MASKFTPGTLPDHAWCTVHRSYKLGCDQYERLIARCGQCCEICGTPGGENPRGKLHIDHCGERWAVRGLLCNACNSVLSKAVARACPPWAAAYLANSWWVTECGRLGVPTDLAPEPDYGSAIRDQWDVVWMREGDGLWRPRGRGRPGISSASWDWLYVQRGPQNMALIDVDDGTDRGFWLLYDAERAALKALVAQVGGELPRMGRRFRDRWPA